MGRTIKIEVIPPGAYTGRATAMTIRVGASTFRTVVIEHRDFMRLRKDDSFYVVDNDYAFLYKWVIWVDRNDCEIQVSSVEELTRLQVKVMEATHDK